MYHFNPLVPVKPKTGTLASEDTDEKVSKDDILS